MASDQAFVDYVLGQIAPDCEATARKMFGEYGVYSKGKIVGSVCDNRVFVKRTSAGHEYIGTPVEASPYPGAKPIFLIEGELEDSEWFSELIRITERELPAPKKKKPKKKPNQTKPKGKTSTKAEP